MYFCSLLTYAPSSLLTYISTWCGIHSSLPKWFKVSNIIMKIIKLQESELN